MAESNKLIEVLSWVASICYLVWCDVSKSCWNNMQILKYGSRYSRMDRVKIFKAVSTNFTWSIPEYLDEYVNAGI